MSEGTSPSIRDVITNGLRYWEPRRLVYNAVLALIVLFHLVQNSSDWRANLSFNGVLGVFLLAVLANVCYCAAYVVDVFAQLSAFRGLWIRWRWLVLLLGVTFAGVITHFFALAMFATNHHS